MTSKRKVQPRKPSRPLGGLVFPKRGAPYKILEDLPREKDDIEQLVVSRFLAMLTETGRKFESPVRPTPPPDWPDFKLSKAGNSIGIELVGLVNQENAVKQGVRNQYLGAIVQNLSDVHDKLRDFSIILDDRYQIPMYPPWRSNQGRKLILEIVSLLREELTDLDSLAPGYARTRRWRYEQNEPAIGAFFSRRSTCQLANDVDISFVSGFPELAEISDSLLARTVQAKIQKIEYFSYPGPLWLLVYPNSILPSHAGTQAIAQAREYLKTIDNSPFDEIWYTVPLPYEQLAHIERIYPVN